MATATVDDNTRAKLDENYLNIFKTVFGVIRINSLTVNDLCIPTAFSMALFDTETSVEIFSSSMKIAQTICPTRLGQITKTDVKSLMPIINEHTKKTGYAYVDRDVRSVTWLYIVRMFQSLVSKCVGSIFTFDVDAAMALFNINGDAEEFVHTPLTFFNKMDRAEYVTTDPLADVRKLGKFLCANHKSVSLFKISDA